MLNKFSKIFLVLCFLFGITEMLSAQSVSFSKSSATDLNPILQETQVQKNPGRALLRSVILPGWGQYYNSPESWRRGQIHLAADISLILGLVYLNTNANRLENNMYSFAQLNAGINLRSAGRTIELAAGNYLTLDEYNQAQLISRNWDRLIEDIPENRWAWQSDSQRLDYLLLRERVESSRQQVPAIITLMVVNRVVSGVSAFVQARNMNQQLPEVSFSYQSEYGASAVMANVSFRF